MASLAASKANISSNSLASQKSWGSSGNLKLEGLAQEALENIEERLYKTLIRVLQETVPNPDDLVMFGALFHYVCGLCATLEVDNVFTVDAWNKCTVPYFTAFMPEEEANVAAGEFRRITEARVEEWRAIAMGANPLEDLGEEVCNIDFSLAYGGKVLLHNTKLWLHRGKTYGVLAHNGAGKTTLLRNIANGKIEGLPEELVRVFVESHFDDDIEDSRNVLVYTQEDPLLANAGAEKIEQMLRDIGFDDGKLNGVCAELSGGWRMMLALARAVLANPDIILLDEPTNHLDVNKVQWLIDTVVSLTHATVLIVSHDTGFLDAVCTDIIHYENQKLVRYPGNLSQFVAKVPSARSYYELESSGGLEFKFPNPGRLDGINSTTRAIARIENVDFRYPGADSNQLNNVSCHLALGSRVAVLGANGAGKSTLIKLLVGETLPSNPDVGNVWKHHNLRVSYVAQHSFHHVEEHLESSPVQYFQWRFKDGADKESLMKETMQLSAEAVEIGEKFGQIEYLHSRRTRGGVLEYEAHFVGMRDKDNKYLSFDVLKSMGLEALMRQVDERVAGEQAAIFGEKGLRTTVTSEVQAHLDDFNLAQEFGTYGKIKGLSGGQKVKLVLAAAMWQCPHLLVLDEPTNYLDREALGALASAIKAFGGGVIMISHAKEFYDALCNEEWLIEDNILKKKGEVQETALNLTREKTEKDILMEKFNETEAVVGGTSNTNEVRDQKLLINEKTGRVLSKKEIRQMAKDAKKKEKSKK